MTIHLETLALLELIEARGSFAAAANALNKAPSAVTYQLRQLEEALDVLIYDRSGHKAKLTPAGKALLDEGRKLLENAEGLKKRVKAVASGWEAELRIVMDSVVPFEVTMPWVQAFDELNSPTRLRFSSEVLSGSWEALFSGRADLLIGSKLDQSQFASGTGLLIQNLGESVFVFAVAPTHPLASLPEPLPVETIRQHRAVAVGDTSRNFKPLTLGLQSGQAVLTVPNLQAKVAAQVAGLGCGWLPWHMVQHELARGELLIKKTEEPLRRTPLCFARPRASTGKAMDWWTQLLSKQTLNWAPQ